MYNNTDFTYRSWSPDNRTTNVLRPFAFLVFRTNAAPEHRKEKKHES